MSERAASLRTLLATLLLGEEERARRAAVSLRDPVLRREVGRLAYQWRVLPPLAQRVKGRGLVEEADEWSRWLLAATTESAWICRRAAHALPRLEQRGAPYLVFKGVAAIATAHRNPAARMVSDCDLLIREVDLEAVLEVLGREGFAPQIPGDLDAWRQLLRERAFPDHDFIEVTHEDGTTIDVHWRIHVPRLEAYRPSELLERAVRGEVLGRSLRVASTPDLLVLTAQHSLREHLAPHVAVKDLLDTRAWLRSGGPAVFEEALAIAGRAGMARGLASMVTCLARLDPSNDSVALALRSVDRRLPEADRVAAGQLANAFRAQLEAGSLHKAVVALSRPSWATFRRFAAGRWHGLRNPDYRAYKFRHEGRAHRWRDARRFVRQTVGLLRRDGSAYRAVARECEALIGASDRVG